MRTMFGVLVCVSIGVSYCSEALGQSLTELEAKKKSLCGLLTEIQHDREKWGEAANSFPEGDMSVQQFGPDEIDQVLARYQRDLQEGRAVTRVILDYFEKCISRLSELSDLAPYLDRFRNANKTAMEHAGECIQVGQEKVSVLEEMRRAYRNHDAHRWNTLAANGPSLMSKQDEAVRGFLSANDVCVSIIEEVQHFLMKRVQLLDNEIARVREAESKRKAETKSSLENSANALAWEAGHPERKAWSDELRQAIPANIGALEKATDIEEFAPNYWSLSASQRIDVWASLFVAIASFESEFNPHAINNKTDNPASVGLLQISYKNQAGYGLEPLDENAKSLEDPLVNLRCGVKILARLVAQNGVVASGSAKNPRGGARYWSTLREGHREGKHITKTEIKEMVKNHALAK